MPSTSSLGDDEFVVIESDRTASGVGDIVFKTGGVERARVKADGTGSGWATVLALPLNVRDYGAKGDGVTDDTAATQAAIDAAQAAVVNSSHVPTVFFPPGEYVWTSQIAWKDCNLVGNYPNTGVRVLWNGAAGGTALLRSVSYGSTGLIYGINFRDGTARPGTWLDLTGCVIDKFLTLDHVQFLGSSGDAIKIGQYVNLHWQHLRFDKLGGWAINALISSSATNVPESFVLSEFTYDCSSAGDTPGGFILFDNAVAARNNLGSIVIANGSIEVNTAGAGNSWVGNKAVVQYNAPASPSSSATCAPLISQVTFSGVGQTANIFYRNTADTTFLDGVDLEGFTVLNGISQILAGSYPASATQPPIPTVKRITGRYCTSEQTIQFRGLRLVGKATVNTNYVPIVGHLSATGTFDFPSVAASGTTTTTLTVTGAALGDTVVVSHSLSLQGMMLTGYVSAANTVTLVLFNPTAGAVDLASGTIRADVWQH